MKENFKKILWTLPFAFPAAFACVFMMEPFKGFMAVINVMIVLLPVIYGLLDKIYPVIVGNLASSFLSAALLLCGAGKVEARHYDLFTPGSYLVLTCIFIFVFQLAVAAITRKISKNKKVRGKIRKAFIIVAAIVPAFISTVSAVSLGYIAYDFNKNGFDDNYSYGVIEHYSEYLYFEGVDAVFEYEGDVTLGNSINTEYYNGYMIYCDAYKKENSGDIYFRVYQQCPLNQYKNEYLSFTAMPQPAQSAKGEELILMPVLEDDRTHKTVSGCFVDDSRSFEYYILNSEGNRLTVDNIEEYFPINIKLTAQPTYVSRESVF